MVMAPTPRWYLIHTFSGQPVYCGSPMAGDSVVFDRLWILSANNLVTTGIETKKLVTKSNKFIQTLCMILSM